MNDFFKYFDGSDASVPVWVMILVSFLLGLIFKSLGCARKGQQSDDTTLVEAGAATAGASALVAEKAKTSDVDVASISTTAKDDLQVIEGIGPKVEGVLNDADIETYRRLGNSNAGELRGVLDKAGSAYKVIVPDSWPEQARLAADGKWDELKEFQEYLVGGVDPAKMPGASESDSSIQPLMGSVEKLKTGTTVSKSGKKGRGKASKKPEDLKIVEGIGPKIEDLLHNAGIASWHDLANSDVEKLRQILRDAGSRFQMHDPQTWPRQAKLADEGKWDELKKYQGLLKGGRA